MYLLSYLLLLVRDIVYFLDHRLKVSIIRVLAFQGPNLPPLLLPDNLLADRDIDCHSL
jgi:hypothetical protein